MNPVPQQVTSRYARNLLVKGKNNEFEIASLSRQYHDIEGLVIGVYYQITIKINDGRKIQGVGVSPEQAVHRCLEKHGVTFR